MRKGIATLFTVLAIGCGGGGGGTAAGGGTAGGEDEYAGPVASTDVAHGQERYRAVCSSCHENGAPALANIAWTPARMRRQIREGSGRMPAIRESRLSAADLEAVLAYLQSIGAVEGGAAQSAAE
jgi:mono/diheme cytochrome c family protein